jgi:hypothetical protein
MGKYRRLKKEWKEKQMKTNEQESAREAMTVIMERLKQAAERLDAEGVLALCRSSGEFLAVIDGETSTYDQFAANERYWLKTLMKHKLTFDSLYIRVLGDDAVAALALFHQSLTDSNKVDTHLTGEFTWIANRIDDGPWELTYVHARHMPDAP